MNNWGLWRGVGLLMVGSLICGAGMVGMASSFRLCDDPRPIAVVPVEVGRRGTGRRKGNFAWYDSGEGND